MNRIWVTLIVYITCTLSVYLFSRCIYTCTCIICTTVSATFWAVNEKANCVAHTVCGKQVINSVTRTIVTGTLTSDTQCQACFAGSSGENKEDDCKVCSVSRKLTSNTILFTLLHYFFPI